jgi:hypothetical protein
MRVEALAFFISRDICRSTVRRRNPPKGKKFVFLLFGATFLGASLKVAPAPGKIQVLSYGLVRRPRIDLSHTRAAGRVNCESGPVLERIFLK